MFSEWRKSINSILYQRVTSPLYGTLIISWSIWNWKIIYLTFFVGQDKIEGNKIDYILSHFVNYDHLVWLPLVSTLGLLTVGALFANGAYWLDVNFTAWRRNQKNIVEGKQRLSIEESIVLRMEMRNQEENFEKLLTDKNEQIKKLEEHISLSEQSSEQLTLKMKKLDEEKTKIIEALESDKSEQNKSAHDLKIEDNKYPNDYLDFKKNENSLSAFKEILDKMYDHGSINAGHLNRMDKPAKLFLIANDIINLDAFDSNRQEYNKILTNKGKAYRKYLINES